MKKAIAKLAQHMLAAHKQKGQEWLDRLPSYINELERDWDLKDLVPFEDISWNFVASGLQKQRKIVLKIGFAHLEIEKERNALEVFSTQTCVEVLNYNPSLGAILLEHAHPGKELYHKRFRDPFKALEISCDLVLKLKQTQKKTDYPFDHVKTLLRKLDKEWALPDDLLSHAREFKKELLQTEEESYVIHGDLHRGNILSHGASWVIIDPKGYIGSVYNEVWPFIHDPEREIPFVAKTLRLDPLKLTKWCFVQTILSATWGLEDGIKTAPILELSRKFLKMIPL